MKILATTTVPFEFEAPAGVVVVPFAEDRPIPTSTSTRTPRSSRVRTPRRWPSSRARRPSRGGCRPWPPARRAGWARSSTRACWSGASAPSDSRSRGNVAAVGARVRGVATTAGERAGFPVFTDADLPTLLPETEVLVLVLPTDPSTDHALNAERIAPLPDRAWVINVGRGSTVDQDALLAALHAGELGGAGLDVVTPEPYPADGPLWDAPNTIITPHAAGRRAHGSSELINDNIALLRSGRPLRNAVPR